MNSVKYRKLLEVFFKDNLIAMIPVLLIGFLLIAGIYHYFIGKEIQNEQEKTRQLAQGIDWQLNNGTQTLKQIATILSYHQSDESISDSAFLVIKHLEKSQDIFQDIEFSDVQGEPAGSLSQQIRPADSTPASIPGFRFQAVDAPPQITLSAKDSSIRIVLPLKENILTGKIDFNAVCAEILGSQGIGDGTLSLALVQEKESPVILRSSSSGTETEKSYSGELIAKAAESKTSDNYIRFPGYGGIVTVAELNSVPWTLISVRDTGRIHYAMIPVIVFLFANLLVVIAYLSILSTHRSYKIKRIIDGFIFQTKRVSEGDLKHSMELQNIYEFNLLANNFNSMVDSIKQRDIKLEFMAFHDRLTGIENRAYLYQKLDQAGYLEAVKTLALVYINVDGFKNVNDTLGHSFGDELLIKVSQILKTSADRDCRLIHLGGDEFACLIPDRNCRGVFDAIHNIRSKFMDSISCCGRNIYISISVGVSMYPDDGKDFDTLLKCADTALHAAKAQGKGSFAFYEPAMNDAVEKRLKIEQHLRSLPELDEFFIVFQSQVSPRGNTIRGFEALLRWNNKELGSVDTGELVSVAEDTGIIVSIGEWVIREACSLIGSLNRSRGTDYTLAVNVSPIQLKSTGFVSNLKEILDQTAFNPNLLELEITENVFIHHKDEAITETLEELLKMGIRVALDDFGTGYSSLSYLNKLPIQTLKVDRNFISNHSNPKTRSMIESIIIMAHKLELSVVAEGVEKEEELAFLKHLNCDFIQGYYFSKPVPFEEILSTELL
ncbi:MAG: diguanylate cyclase [Bacillota bacterium]|nr:diguanylate cyclase [Bacillota bacterium]